VLRRSSRLIVSLGFVALGPALAQQPSASAQQRFDILITGARVYDGTGNPWFYADLGIRGDRIAAVGNLTGAQATRTIDARGRILTPGFIDLHSHADDASPGGLRSNDAKRRAAPNLVAQGVTTVVVNHDGRSPWPIADQRGRFERDGIGPNALLLVGHGAVRGRVMGNDTRRPATGEEITRMRALVRQGLLEGASGLSAGLEYEPGRWSTIDEVVELAREIVPFQGVYISHERAEGQDPMWYWPSQDPPGPPTLLDAVRETIEIGERTGAKVVASHIKAKGANYWGSSRAAIQLIEAARARGVEVWADQYTYNTSGTDGSTVLIPDWVYRSGRGGRGGRGAPALDSAPGARAGGGGRGAGGRGAGGAGRGGRGGGTSAADALRAVLADSASVPLLRRDIAHEIARRGGADNVVILDYPDSTVIGKSVGQVARERNLSPVDAAIDLQLKGNPGRQGGGRMRGFSMSEIDMEAFAAQPWVATASDAGIAMPGDSPGTHARFYGTFPRKIQHYALARGVISVEDAVRSMSSLPAQILGFKDRGLLREGYVADVVVLDLDRYGTRATFFEPHQYAEGVHHVLVNGQFVLDDGELTFRLPGKVLMTGGPRPAPVPGR
jgi:N-acyl-D-amino-acid deacylase